MSKVIMEFILPDDSNDLKLAQRGNEYFCVIYDTLQEIRRYLKYGHSFQTIDEALETIREKLYEAQIDDIE